MAKQQQTRCADFIFNAEKITASVAANAADLPHLETPRVKLEGITTEVRSLTIEQGVHAANKQQTSQRLKALVADGKKLVTFLRTGVKEHYGNRAEKVAEFGVQPFRRRARQAAAPPEIKANDVPDQE